MNWIIVFSLGDFAQNIPSKGVRGQNIVSKGFTVEVNVESPGFGRGFVYLIANTSISGGVELMRNGV